MDPDFDDRVRLDFNEPIEVGRNYQQEVQLRASPAYRYSVSFGFSSIRLEPEEGWRRGVIYTFTFPPDYRDLLGNRATREIPLTFSTGPPIPETRVSGRVLDRISGAAVGEARLLFLAEEGDSIPYTAVTDDDGRFVLRALPPGRYRALGFRDLNRNLSLERRIEPYDSTFVELTDPEDSAEFSLWISERDTTPPVLVRAEALDSLVVRMEFDDHLDPEQDFEVVEVAVTEAETERPWPVERVAARADDLEPEEREDEGEEPDEDVGTEERPLPGPEAFVLLGEPLEAEVTYRIRADGFRNLWEFEGGGDTTFVYAAPPPSEEDVPAETGGS